MLRDILRSLFLLLTVSGVRKQGGQCAKVGWLMRSWSSRRRRSGGVNMHLRSHKSINRSINGFDALLFRLLVRSHRILSMTVNETFELDSIQHGKKRSRTRSNTSRLALMMIAEQRSRSLFHQSASDGVECRNESMIPNFSTLVCLFDPFPPRSFFFACFMHRLRCLPFCHVRAPPHQPLTLPPPFCSLYCSVIFLRLLLNQLLFCSLLEMLLHLGKQADPFPSRCSRPSDSGPSASSPSKVPSIFPFLSFL